VIQWFVEPGATVEEFSPLCEVQSDKASVEITSRFAGTVKKLHYEAGEMARVGHPFIDIDIQDGAKQVDIDALTVPGDSQQEPPAPAPAPAAPHQQTPSQSQPQTPSQPPAAPLESPLTAENAAQEPKPKGKCAALATPAVRHLSKELNVDITDIDGTGRDGRVLKEDIYNFVKRRDSRDSVGIPSPPSSSQASQAPSREMSTPSSAQTETVVPLSKTQLQMFKTMTRSLTIPHFLYTDEINFSQLVELRGRLNRVLAKSGSANGQPSKLSYLPFIIKAVSLALYQFPMLNARVDVDAATGKPALVHRAQHNIGVAMDTPQGLVVPVIRNVGALNVLSIAAELARLQGLAVQGRLSPRDMTGGTITVSNIGNIGGTYLSPVIVEREVAILGIGRMRAVPAFDDDDRVVKRHVCNFSWSADHRVIDGATMARAADVVRSVVEEPDVMVMHLR
jgi:2-oxoisovalerate dehydrogenase E2 component (dihydrolipoyl transacylase)